MFLCPFSPLRVCRSVPACHRGSGSRGECVCVCVRLCCSQLHIKTDLHLWGERKVLSHSDTLTTVRTERHGKTPALTSVRLTTESKLSGGFMFVVSLVVPWCQRRQHGAATPFTRAHRQTHLRRVCQKKKEKWTNHDSPQLEIHQTKLTTPKRNNFTPLYLLGGGANCLYKPQMTKPLRCNLVSNNPKTKWVSFCWPLIREVKLFFHYFEVCGRLINLLNSLSSRVWVKARQLLPSSARRVSKVP